MDENTPYFRGIKQKFSRAEIERVLSKLADKNVLIIGDTIIDEYVFVKLKGRAIKDPILSTEFGHCESYAGGILAIANHISTFVKKVKVVTMLGDVDSRKDFIQESVRENVELTTFTKVNAPTVIKRRYIDAYKNNKLFKIEHMDDAPISQELTRDIILAMQQELPQYDLVIVADFGHGFLNNDIRKVIEDVAPFLALNVQSNSSNMGYNYFTQYHRADFLTANEEEARLPLSTRFRDLPEITREISEKWGFSKILITRGKKGCLYFQNHQFLESPALTTIVKDTVGAGDALFSIAALIAFLNESPELLPFIANCAGALGATTMGNKESVTKEKLLKLINEIYRGDIKQYLDSVNRTISTISLEQIDAFVQLLLEVYQQGRTVYVFGNGGSSATASHFCGDLIKGVSYGLDKRFRAVCLNDNLPALMAIANDISYDDIFVEQLKNFLNPGDVVIGISGSGNSTNVVKAIEYANQQGAKTVAICGFKGGKMKEVAHLSIHANVNDMEVSEDIHHLILTHCVKRIMTKELNNTNLGKEYEKRIE